MASMEVVERTQRKVVVRHRRREILHGVLCCFMFALIFYLLDAKHPKASLLCTRHAVLPDNELERVEGLHVEDIDCSLTVRPTRTALDLTFFEEISYSFEIVSARLSHPPKRPREKCRRQCSGKVCICRERDGSSRPAGRHLENMTDADYKADEEGGTETAAADGVVSEGPPHHSFHLGVNDVATLVLEDNLGNTYDFYTFQDEAVAERMLEKVQSFIHEAREGVSQTLSEGMEGDGAGKAEQEPLELEVLYDDSWLDEVACILFLVSALVLMTRPYTELVEFDAESGAMALDRWNLLQCGVFRYSCALENVSKLEITEADVWIMSAHAFEQLRQGKEFGLRMLFSLPQGDAATRTRPSSARENGSNSAGNAGSSATASGTALPTGVASLYQTNHRLPLRGRSLALRSAGSGGGYMYLELGFGKKAQDDRKLRRPVELVNDLLLRFSSDMETESARKSERSTDGNCCVCFRRRARVVTFPCMHMGVCPQCSASLSACPLCRSSITERHTVFL